MSQLHLVRDKNESFQQKKSTNGISFLRSQYVLFDYRKRWGFIYGLATLAGILAVPGTFQAFIQNQNEQFPFMIQLLALPISSFLIILGMYVFNDLIDSDLDRANGKQRPISTRLVSKGRAMFFIASTNILGFLLSAITFNPMTMMISLLLVTIGVMYSVPKVALKDRFIIKTFSIAIAMALCITLGSLGTWSFNDNSFNIRVAILLYSAIMLGSMVFITSPFNDVADVEGDRAAGRKTIPIVIALLHNSFRIYLASLM